MRRLNQFDKHKRNEILLVLIIAVCVILVAACESKPTPFEPTGVKVIVPGCEDMKARNEKANC